MSPTTLSAHETDLAELQAQGAELIARDGWSREQLLAFQRGRLQELIAHATAASPYYREVLGPEAGSGEIPLEQLPTLSKATLIDQFDRIVTDPRLRLAELEEHLQGSDPGALFLNRYRVFSTSGTSGVRALIVYSEEEFRFWVAASLRIFARAGITPTTRLVPIGAPNPLHITRELFAAFRSGRAGTPELSVLTPLDEIVSALNDYQPEAVVGYASLAALLAREQLDGRLRDRAAVRRGQQRGPHRRSAPVDPRGVGRAARPRSTRRPRPCTSPTALRPTPACTSTKTSRSSRSSTSTTGPCRPASRATRCSSRTSPSARNR